MAYFLVRVELQKRTAPLYPEYKTLHRKMGKKGFSRHIISEQDISYHLPEAEYFIDGNYTIDDIHERAYMAALSIEPDPVVITVQADQVKWAGLKPSGNAGGDLKQ